MPRGSPLPAWRWRPRVEAPRVLLLDDRVQHVERVLLIARQPRLADFDQLGIDELSRARARRGSRIRVVRLFREELIVGPHRLVVGAGLEELPACLTGWSSRPAEKRESLMEWGSHAKHADAS